jgi:hypothetical protein
MSSSPSRTTLQTSTTYTSTRPWPTLHATKIKQPCYFSASPNLPALALNQELTEHLGHEKNTPAGNEAGNIRNGSRPKTVLTEGTGQIAIEVPRDRDGTFTPQIVKKRQRRLNGVDEIVLSLYAKGLTTGKISAHFAEIYGASVSKETVSRSPTGSSRRGRPGPPRRWTRGAF